jgi:hypothetical protein
MNSWMQGIGREKVKKGVMPEFQKASRACYQLKDKGYLKRCQIKIIEIHDTLFFNILCTVLPPVIVKNRPITV